MADTNAGESVFLMNNLLNTVTQRPSTAMDRREQLMVFDQRLKSLPLTDSRGMNFKPFPVVSLSPVEEQPEIIYAGIPRACFD